MDMYVLEKCEAVTGHAEISTPCVPADMEYGWRGNALPKARPFAG